MFDQRHKPDVVVRWPVAARRVHNPSVGYAISGKSSRKGWRQCHIRDRVSQIVTA